MPVSPRGDYSGVVERSLLPGLCLNDFTRLALSKLCHG